MSNSTTIVWKADPDYRGTLNIITACYGTLFICIWSAIHDDITKGKHWIQIAFRKTCWTLVGLFAPEFILYIAFRQFMEARRLLQKVNRSSGISCQEDAWYRRLMPWYRRRKPGLRGFEPLDVTVADEQAGHKHAWTMTHAFFIMMNGFKFDCQGTVPQETSPLGISWLHENGDDKLRGFETLLRADAIPYITAQVICDKSKANGLAKVVLVWQALWFCVTAVARLVQDLPFSLLEVMTIAHAICTLMAYAFWWSKPKDVNEPIVIPADHSLIAKLAAAGITANMGHACETTLGAYISMEFLFMTAQSVRVDGTDTLPVSFFLDESISQVTSSSSNMDPYSESEREFRAPGDPSKYSSRIRQYRFTIIDENTIIATEAWNEGTMTKSHYRIYSEKPIHKYIPPVMPTNLGVLEQKGVILPLRSFKIPSPSPVVDPAASEARNNDVWQSTGSSIMANHTEPQFESPVDLPIVRFALAHDLFEAVIGSGSEHRQHASPLVQTATLWASKLHRLQVASWSELLLLSVLPAIYGAPHLLGWNAVFPTVWERLFWRISSLAVMGSAFVTFGLIVAGRIAIHISESKWWHKLCGDSNIQNLIETGLLATWVPTLALVPLFYVLASGFLLLESFRQLIALPPGAFELSAWTKSIPHFG